MNEDRRFNIRPFGRGVRTAMKTLRIHSLSKGWCDKDDLMLHAAFQILVDYVEKENPGEKVDWKLSQEHKHAWREIRSLYKWWTLTRQGRVNPLEEKGLRHPPIRWKKVPGSNLQQLVDYDRKEYSAYERALRKHWQLEKKWQSEDEQNLHRLVDVRRYLWT